MPIYQSPSNHLQKRQETMSVTVKSDDVQPRTTCEVYHAVGPLDLRPSVQSSFFYYLHHVLARSQSQKSINKFEKRNRFGLKNKIKSLIKNIYPSGNSLGKYHSISSYQCDVIFNFFASSPHSLGIQRKLAEQCQLAGLKTGMVGIFAQRRDRNLLAMDLPEFDHIFPLQQFNEIFEFNLPRISRQKIIEQCRHIQLSLEKFGCSSPNASEYLAECAIQVEKKACIFQRLLEEVNPKIVILSHGKTMEDAAMLIACHKADKKSMLVPHGFPQKSMAPIHASIVTSFGPHHDRYLKDISRSSTQIMKLGWLEPSTTLKNNVCNISDNSSRNKGKYNVLFLSSLYGWEIHRCESLLERVPDILKTLNKMPEIETINVRLRHNEYNDLVIKTLLSSCAGSKLRRSGMNNPISDDLNACDIIISFNSTALLYGPYLNKKSIEIRDQKINSVWGSSVLPSKQVYQINEVFDSQDFCQFILDSPVLKGNSVFYNWGHELKTFSDYLKSIV